jgi:hypothetical protein
MKIGWMLVIVLVILSLGGSAAQAQCCGAAPAVAYAAPVYSAGYAASDCGCGGSYTSYYTPYTSYYTPYYTGYAPYYVGYGWGGGWRTAGYGGGGCCW